MYVKFFEKFVSEKTIHHVYVYKSTMPKCVYRHQADTLSTTNSIAL